MAETKTFLVAGVTGKQGGAVARSLVGRGHTVRGLVRDPTKARALAKGIEGVQGDLTDKGSLTAALKGAEGFFIVTTPFRPDFSVDTAAEVRQGTTAVDAAKAVSVPHVVLTSVASADQGTGIPHFESKAQVERHLGASGLTATIVRPVSFMENILSPWMAPAIKGGSLPLPIPAKANYQMVATKDIGEIVARAFERPRVAAGRTVELAGDEMAAGDLAVRLSKKVGHPVGYHEVPEEEVRRTMGDDAVKMYRWFRKTGYHVDIPALEREWGYPMTRFDEFLAQARWEG